MSTIGTTRTDALINRDSEVAEVKFASISEATAANNELVAAVAGKKIRVIGLNFVCTGANTITFKSATDAISGAMGFDANSGLGGLYAPTGLMETAVGEALNMTQSAATQVSGFLSYIEVTP